MKNTQDDYIYDLNTIYDSLCSYIENCLSSGFYEDEIKGIEKAFERISDFVCNTLNIEKTESSNE